ncbi:MAG: hypothetical protein WCF90_01785 [Methanomicrobiales archaeon]
MGKMPGQTCEVLGRKGSSGIGNLQELTPGADPPLVAGRIASKRRLQGYVTARIFHSDTAVCIFVAGDGENESSPLIMITSTEGWMNWFTLLSRLAPADPGIDCTTTATTTES